jgi:hypothetical protein
MSVSRMPHAPSGGKRRAREREREKMAIINEEF